MRATATVDGTADDGRGTGDGGVVGAQWAREGGEDVRTRRASRAGALATLVLAALASAGCSIPTQGAPSVIPRSRVPFGLLDKHPPTTTTIAPSVYVPVKVFFFGPTNQLQSVERNVPTPAPLAAILAAMLAGPSKAEAAGGIATAIPNNVAVISATANSTTNGTVVTVNMNSAFGAITGNNAEEAVAQVVATVAAAYGPTTGVLFEISGQHLSVPVANGSLKSGPVYLLEFAGVTP